jgi:hypothetical protein
MRGFVKDYIVLIHHGETVVVNDDDEEEDDAETLESLSQYSAKLDALMDPEFGNEQGGDAGGWDGNDEGGANNDGGARVGVKDDYDNLEKNDSGHWTRDFTKQLERSRKFGNGKKASKETVYGVEEGCPTYWTQCYVLYLSYSSGRISMAGQTVVSMIYCVSIMVAATTKLSSCQHIPSKEGYKSIDNGG